MPKPLSPFVMVFLGLDMIIGLGLFTLPATVVTSLRGWTLVTGVLLTAVIAMLAALARLTSRNGGPYAYLSLAFGPKVAVPLSWAYCLGLAVGTGCYLSIVADVLTRSTWLGVGLLQARMFCLVYLAAIAGISVVGLGFGSRTMLAIVILKATLPGLLSLLRTERSAPLTPRQTAFLGIYCP